MTPPRIASLLPSATETVCALGAEADLVGVSHECDHPETVKGLTVLTSNRVSPGTDSAAIDEGIRDALKDALAIYAIDEEALAAAKPDVIVTQDLCEVCAVSYDEVLAAVRRKLGPEVRLLNLHPTRLADVLGDIVRVGAAIERETEARAVVAEMEARMEAVRERAAAWIEENGSEAPHVLTLEWLDPAMVGGTWMPDLVTLAGGVPLVTEPGQHAPTLTPGQLAALDPAPDVVLIKPCGYTVPRIVEEADVLSLLLTEMPWPAVRDRRVWIADGSAFFNRPGPRLVESLEILAACLHPNAFPDFARQHAGSFRRFGVRQR
ncbi:MAG: ABC transporter substrate-binding protein [Planctomycetota bacterium]|jgi:iron complex transport system substrate-binding protein